MKKLLFPFALVLFIGCNGSGDKTDNEKAESETKIEIKTDSGEVKINKEGISIQSSEDGIKIEGKDGKVELKTDDGGKIKIEKKGKDVNINIKEN